MTVLAVSVAGSALLAGCGSSTAASPAPAPTTVVGTSSPPGQPSSSPPLPVATELNPPGDIPDTRAYVRYASTPAGFTIKVPEGWARTNVGSEIVFSDKLNSIAVSQASSSAAPTTASILANLVPTLSSSISKFHFTGVQAVQRGAGPAVLVTYQQDSAVDPVTNKVVRDSVERYLFWHAGRLVTVILTGPLGADNVDPWRKVTDSLSWTS